MVKLAGGLRKEYPLIQSLFAGVPPALEEDACRGQP